MAARNELMDSIMALLYSMKPFQWLFLFYQRLRQTVNARTMLWSDPDLIDPGTGNKTYTVTSDDFFINFDATGKPAGKTLTVTLPKAELNYGRMLIFRNTGHASGEITLTPATGECIPPLAANTSITMTANSAYHFVGGHNGTGVHGWIHLRDSI